MSLTVDVETSSVRILCIYASPKAACIPERGLRILLEGKHDSCIHQITYHTVISYDMASNEHHHINFKVAHIKIFYVHLSLPEQLLLTRSSLPPFT